MELSKRLMCIINNMDKCESIIDVGTDHGYIPIYAVKNNLCKWAVASDINKGPKEKAENNVRFEGLKEKIHCRLGGGLAPLKKGEAKVAIIAGMGGNLIRDIILKDIDKVKEFDYMILQPAQNSEILREFLYTNSFDVIKEDLVEDEGFFYEVFKVRYSLDKKIGKMEPFYYEVSKKLLEDKNPLMGQFIKGKIEKCETILSFIKEDTEGANFRKLEIKSKIQKLEELC